MAWKWVQGQELEREQIVELKLGRGQRFAGWVGNLEELWSSFVG